MPKWKPIEKEAGGIRFKAWQCSECGYEWAFQVECCPQCLSKMNLIKEEHKMNINLEDHRKVAEANKICTSGDCEGCIYVDDDDCGNVIRNDSFKALTDLIEIVENSLCDDGSTDDERKPVIKKRDSVSKHKEICNQLNAIYAEKNADYGDSFHITFEEEGFAMARLRLSDKLNRFKTLTKTVEQHVKEESVRDTLLDLANYAIMTVMEMEEE